MRRLSVTILWLKCFWDVSGECWTSTLKGPLIHRRVMVFRNCFEKKMLWNAMKLFYSHPWIYICIKRKKKQLKQYVFLKWILRVLFTNWPGILCTFCFWRDQMTCYECSKLCWDKSVCVMFLYHNFMKTRCFLSKLFHAYNCIQVRILEKHWLFENQKLSQNHILLSFHILLCKWIPLMRNIALVLRSHSEI